MSLREDAVPVDARASETTAVTVVACLNGVPVPLMLNGAALAALAALAAAVTPGPAARPSPYMTIPEAAEFLRCSRQRVDDLLSQRRLTRFKDGGRTLVLREDVEAYVIREGRR